MVYNPCNIVIRGEQDFIKYLLLSCYLSNVSECFRNFKVMSICIFLYIDDVVDATSAYNGGKSNQDDLETQVETLHAQVI